MSGLHHRLRSVQRAGGGGLASNQLKFTVQTTTASESFTFPTGWVGAITVDAEIEWGDGNSSTVTTWDDANFSHTYAGAGTYDITITGQAAAIAFNNGGHVSKILAVESGPACTVLPSLSNFLDGAVNCEGAFPTLVTSITQSGYDIFRNTGLSGVCDLSGWSSITSLNSAFQDCAGLTGLTSDTPLAANSFNAFCYNATGLVDVAAGLFDNLVSPANYCFYFAFRNCSLSEQSVENILVSIAASGQSGPTTAYDIRIDGTPSVATIQANSNISAAVTTLKSRGWDPKYNNTSL